MSRARGHQRRESSQAPSRSGRRRAGEHARAAIAHRRFGLWLWSRGGERIVVLDVLADDEPPAFCLHENVRYDRVPRQSMTARVIHYQTLTITPRAVPWLAQAVSQ
jgi:hypothetical protein